MTYGKFITFDGIDGSGKTTQAQLLQARLVELNFDVVLTREPGGSEAAEALRSVFIEHDWDGWEELHLLTAGRRNHVRTTILPALKRGAWVISDRFTAGTYAYQGFGRGIPLEIVRWFTNSHVLGIKPRLTIILNANLATTLSRIEARRKDRIEQLSMDFYLTVRQGFQDYVARENPNRSVLINANHGPVETADAVWSEVKRRLL